MTNPKRETLSSYLDTILKELGHRGRLHECPDCGKQHLGPA